MNSDKIIKYKINELEKKKKPQRQNVEPAVCSLAQLKESEWENSNQLLGRRRNRVY